MKRFTLPGMVAVLFVLLVSMTVRNTPAERVLFVSEQGKFSIQFNRTPVKSTKKVNTDAGIVKLYMFLHEESNAKAYMVAYCDYKKKLMVGSNANEVLRNAKEGVINQFEATVKSENSFLLQGHEALDFTASGPQYHTAYRLVLVDNRLYQIGVLQTTGIVPKIDITTFIETFKILE